MQDIKVLLIDTDLDFYEKIQDELLELDVDIELADQVNMPVGHDFYFIGNVAGGLINHLEHIRNFDLSGKIYVFDCNGHEVLPISRVIHLNITGCIPKDIDEVCQEIKAEWKTETKIHEASNKLDDIKNGILVMSTPFDDTEIAKINDETNIDAEKSFCVK